MSDKAQALLNKIKEGGLLYDRTTDKEEKEKLSKTLDILSDLYRIETEKNNKKEKVETEKEEPQTQQNKSYTETISQVWQNELGNDGIIGKGWKFSDGNNVFQGKIVGITAMGDRCLNVEIIKYNKTTGEVSLYDSKVPINQFDVVDDNFLSIINGEAFDRLKELYNKMITLLNY